MLRNSNPFWGDPCTDAINSIKKNPSSLIAQVLCLWKHSIQVTRFAGGKALPAIIDTWTRYPGCPLKKGSIPACIFPSQTGHAGRDSEEARWWYLAKRQDADSKTFINILLPHQTALPMTCSVLHFQEPEAVSIFRSLCFQHCARPAAHHSASADNYHWHPCHGLPTPH